MVLIVDGVRGKTTVCLNFALLLVFLYPGLCFLPFPAGFASLARAGIGWSESLRTLSFVPKSSSALAHKRTVWAQDDEQSLYHQSDDSL